MSMDTLLLQVGTPAEASAGTTGLAAAGYHAPSPMTAVNLGAAFFDVARARADHPAMVTKAGTFSYGWILCAADRVRRYLRNRPGYVAGARVRSANNTPW